MEDLLAIARKASRVLAARAGNRFSLDELESAALFGVVLAIRDFDESKGSLAAYASVRARSEVMTEMRDRHPDGNPRTGGLKTRCSGLGHEDLGALSRAHARAEPDEEAACDLLRRIRMEHSPKDAVILALTVELGSYDAAARAIGITPEAVYRRLRLVRRGRAGRALARRYGVKLDLTGAPSRS